MSMLTRTGTIIRKQRRRSSATSRTSSRRESATTPTPSMCPIPSPSSSYSTYNHGGNYLHYQHSSELFISPFSTPDPSPLSLAGVKDMRFSFDVSAVKGHLALSKLNRAMFLQTTFIMGPVQKLLNNTACTKVSILLTPPPSDKPIYESTVIWAEVEEADPHYSLLGSLCEASIEAKHPCDFIHRAMFIICGTWRCSQHQHFSAAVDVLGKMLNYTEHGRQPNGNLLYISVWPVTVFTLVLLALPLVMTAIGVNYLHECPREPKLPIYLVVGGCFGIIKLIFVLWKQIKRHRDDVIDLHDDEDLLTMTRMTNMALNVFLSVWFVFGHYWLIRIWKPHFEAPLHEPRNWCDEAVFLFTFWQLVICHIIIGMVILMAIVLYCCYICVKCFVHTHHHQAQQAHQQQQQQQKTDSKR